MNKTLTKSIFLLASSFITVTANANPRDNGFYAGIDTSSISSASTYFETTANISATGSHLNQRESTFRGSTIEPETLKVGYKHLNKNRIELFKRYTSLLVGDSEEKIAVKTLGLNYEFGISSLTSKNKKLLPYISLGAAGGTASTNSNKLKLKKAEVVELDFSVGVHYQLSEHFDTTLGLNHRATLLLDNAKNNTNDIFTDGDIDTTTLSLGISYHF